MNIVNQLVFNYKNQPEKICLVQGDRVVTYGEFYKKVSSLKKYLEKNGVEEGTKVLVFSQMSIDLYITLFSIWSLGAVACIIDEEYLKNDIHKFDFSKINVLIESTKYALYSSMNEHLMNLEKRININIIDFLEEEEELEITPVEGDFPAMHTYTLGKDGITKIAERSHKFLEKQSEILQENLRYDSRDVELSSIPFFALTNIDIGITTVIADANFSD